MTKSPRVWILCGLALAGAASLRLRAQIEGADLKYDTGQDVAPIFEGWEANPDGAFSMVFGYLNRNYQEEVDIPIGPDNSIDLDSNPDHGQPTHFYTRRQHFIFKVVVPKDWDKQKRLVWTLTSHGKTDRAKGWLQPEWELSDAVISENNGGGVLDEGNKAPTISGDSSETVALGEKAALTVTANDDGIPRIRTNFNFTGAPVTPSAGRGGPGGPPQARMGVQIKWIMLRGPGRVTFDPETSPRVYGKPNTFLTKASFSAPGTYLLRATASDGQLFGTHEVTVVVKPK